MNVLHVSSAITWRGGEQQIAYLIDGQERADMNVGLMCPGSSVLYERSSKWSVQLFSYRKTSGVSLRTSNRLRSIARQFRADVVHVHDAHAHTYAWVAALLGMRIPIVVSRRVDFPISAFGGLKYNHSQVRRVLCVSQAIKDIIGKRIRDGSKISVVHDGIDTDRFERADRRALRRQYKLPADCLCIGNVAALADHKDYLTFVNVAHRFLNEVTNEVRFFIIGGDAGAGSRIRHRIDDLQLEDRIFMHGFEPNIADVLGSLDFFLCTSKTEGLGTSVLDAFAAGVPVVSTTAGGLKEIAIHEHTALTANVGNVQSLCNHLKRLTRDAALRDRLKGNARTFVQTFDKQHMVDKTAAAYRAILD